MMAYEAACEASLKSQLEEDAAYAKHLQDEDEAISNSIESARCACIPARYPQHPEHPQHPQHPQHPHRIHTAAAAAAPYTLLTHPRLPTQINM
jgi:hypothetical protein